MKALFYYNKSESIKVDKVLYYITEFDITLKTSVSLKNPIVDLDLKYENNEGNYGVVDSNNDDIAADGDDLALDLPYDVTDFNYCYIPTLKRYYYINNVILVTSRLYRLELSLDVLMSFKDSILDIKAFITRNENLYNPLIKDDIIAYETDRDVSEQSFAHGIKVDTTFIGNNNIYYKNFVITVVNESSIVDNSSVTGRPMYKLSQVGAYISGIYNQNASYGTSALEMSFLTEKIMNDDTLKSYIISVTSFPFAVETKDTGEYLLLGDTRLEPEEDDGVIIYNGVEVYKLKYPQGNFHTIADFTYEIENPTFLDYEPYTIYEIYVPYLSYVRVPSEAIINKRILVTYSINYQNGSAQAFIISDNRVIYTASCQIGIQVGLSTTNALEVKNNEIINGINLGLNLTSGALSMGVGAMSGNPVAVAMGGIQTAKAIGNYISSDLTNYNHASGQINSATQGVFAPLEVYVRTSKVKPKSYNNDFAKLYGKPLNEVHKLSELSGYTVINEIHLENIQAYENEKIELYDLLKNGIIL